MGRLPDALPDATGPRRDKRRESSESRPSLDRVSRAPITEAEPNQALRPIEPGSTARGNREAGKTAIACKKTGIQTRAQGKKGKRDALREHTQTQAAVAHAGPLRENFARSIQREDEAVLAAHHERADVVLGD